METGISMDTLVIEKEKQPGMLNLLQCKCPRCRQGKMFVSANPWNLKTTMKMNETCPVCKQPFNIEVGFYYGTGYVSYALAIAFTVATLIAWWLLIGISVDDNRVFGWLAVNTILLVLVQPYFMRLARTLWLAFFVWYDKDWKTNAPKKLERVNKGQENNW